jgi:3-phenylpropionate/cinnamic acid dioxygenase small subunit
MDALHECERIRRLIALYAQHIDSRRFAEWGELFSEDATFSVWGRTYRGRAEIVREIGGMQPERPGKHMPLQPVIDLDPGGRSALAWTDLAVLFTGEDGRIGVATLGRYHDRLVEQHGRWRFASRVLVLGDEAVPPGTVPPPAC